jgi:hypothetical protein
MGLQATGVGALHILADVPHPAGVHGVMGEDALFDEVLQVGAVQGGVENGGEEGHDLGLFPMADGLDQ